MGQASLPVHCRWYLIDRAAKRYGVHPEEIESRSGIWVLRAEKAELAEARAKAKLGS